MILKGNRASLSAVFVLLLPCVSAQELRTAQELLNAGNYPSAESTLRRLASKTPNDAAVWNLLGATHAQMGRLDEAEKDFGTAAKLQPRAVSVWLNLGRIYQMQVDAPASLDQGIQAYRKALSLQPENPEAHHQLALLLEWKGQFAESLKHLDLLPKADQERRSALAVRLADEASLGSHDRALKTADLLFADPQLEEGDIMAVFPAIEAHDKPAALRVLEMLDQRQLAGEETLSKLGNLYVQNRDFRSARNVFQRQFKLNPNSASALNQLARIAWELNDYNGVLSYLAHAREIDPKDPSIHFLFGLAANELKLPSEARASLLKAVELAPDHPYYNYALGALQLQWREKDSAIPYLEKYAAAKPEDPRGHMALGLAYLSVLRTDAAEKQIAPLTGNREFGGGVEFLLGRIASQQSDFKKAEKHFRRAAELDAKSADAYAELGASLLKLQRPEEAHSATRAALDLDKNNYAANMNLLRLYRLKNDSRAEEQSARVKALVEQHDTDLKMLQRTIEIRPDQE